MAYAAVISLKRNLQRLKIPTSPLIKIDANKELDSLKETLSTLDSSSNTSCNRTVIYSLDAEIREAVSKLEDMLESYTFHRSLPPSHIHGDQGSPQLQIPLVDENGVKEEIDSFMKTVKKLSEEYKKELENPSPIEEEDAAASSTDDSGGKNSTETVGLKDQFDEIIDGLMDLQSKHKIISLYGMAGIGKTHLAREVYRLPSIIQEFDLQIWVSISPQFRIKNVMADIAAQIDRRPRTEYINEDMKTLSERVRESLSGQRYFIVLDDIWSKAAWDALKRWFPIEQNGSRILLTTRLEEAATYPTTLSNAHQIRFLNNDESWNLLWQNVFVSSKSFPSKLEKVGRKIAENCEGLPLLILAVAHILCRLEKTEEFWMKVAEMKTTVFTDAYENISEVLLLSYEYLPQYLKACFLYMGVFPKNSEIPISKLMDLWTIEDFIEPNKNETLDFFALNCLKKLVSQSLAIVCKQSSSSGIKSSKLHSAYWHLCVKEARKNKFLHVLNSIKDIDEGCIERHCRLASVLPLSSSVPKDLSPCPRTRFQPLSTNPARSGLNPCHHVDLAAPNTSPSITTSRATVDNAEVVPSGGGSLVHGWPLFQARTSSHCAASRSRCLISRSATQITTRFSPSEPTRNNRRPVARPSTQLPCTRDAVSASPSPASTQIWRR